MSDSILNEGFFDNKDVPDSAKLGATALLLNGTFETYKRGNGNVTTLVSHVGGGNGSMVTVMYDIGDNTSMGKINAEATAKQLSSQNFNVSNILAGAIADQTVISSTADEFKRRFGTNDTALKDNVASIEAKLRKYFKLWHEKDPNAISPTVADKLIEDVKEAYTSQKKNKVTPSQAVVNE